MKTIAAWMLALLLLLTACLAQADTVWGHYLILQENELPQSLMERRLNDSQIGLLANADLDTLKHQIATFGDFIGWLHAASEAGVGADSPFSVAQYVLAEDYPGLYILVCAVQREEELEMKRACCIPAEEGFYLLDPGPLAGMEDDAAGLGQQLLVSDPISALAYCRDTFSGRPVQALALDTAVPAELEAGLGGYTADNMTGIRTLYSAGPVYRDKLLTCRECGKAFPFTAEEQAFYAENGFQNEPTRCADCRAAAREKLQNTPKERVSYTTTCAQCGKEITVPFVPNGDRPVYCNDCYRALRP